MDFFTADLHFMHKNILKYCNRQTSSIEEMNEQLITAINNTVTEKDTLYILGDVAIGSVAKAFDYLCRINCKIVLIPGNHDDPKLLRLVNEHPNMTVENTLVSKKLNGQYMVMSHFPLAIWDRQHYKSWHLHGHSHGSYVVDHGLILDVGVDSYVNLYGTLGVFSMEQIREYMAYRTMKDLDHHSGEEPR